MGCVMSEEVASVSHRDDIVGEGVQQLCSALDDNLLVNVVGPGVMRRHLFGRAAAAVEGTERIIYSLDGRIHGYGDMVEAFKSAMPVCHGKGGIIVVDNWSMGLVSAGNAESFRRWIEYMDRRFHSLVFGTARPLGSALDERGQRLFPPRKLAEMCLVPCNQIVPSEQRDRINPGVAAGAVAAALATGVGAVAISRHLKKSTDEQREGGEEEPTTLERALRALKGGIFGGTDNSRNGTESGREEEPGENKNEEDLDEALQKLVIEDEAAAKEVTGKLRSSGKSMLKIGQLLARAKVFRERLDWMSDDERRELVALSAIDPFDSARGDWKRLIEFANEAREWRRFLCLLAEHHRQVVEESKALGFELHGDDAANLLGIHLKKVGMQPDEFAAGLFRVSDLIQLFPGYRPDEEEQRAFLSRQFEKWRRDEELDIRKLKNEDSATNSKREVKRVVQPEESVEFPSVGEDDERRPVRKLYRLLLDPEIGGALKDNLQCIDDYAELRGPTEARFCEWVYARMEKRQLLDGLAGSLLLFSHEKKLRKQLGLPLESKEFSWPESLREVLTEIGVCEPELAPTRKDGEYKLRTAKKYFCNSLSAEDIDLQAYNDEKGLHDARKGLEKSLQLIAVFLWQTELKEMMRSVIVEGRHGFEPGRWTDVEGGENSETSDLRILKSLKSSTAGPLNHLLRALSKECEAQGVRPPFLRGEEGRRELWPEKLFQRIRSLLEPLNKLMHEDLKDSEEDRQRFLEQIPDRLEKVVLAIDEDLLRIPRPVRFFRKYHDGHGVHFEGYTNVNERIWFYEVRQDYELGEAYLFLAATNPSAVDMTCVPRSKVYEE